MMPIYIIYTVEDNIHQLHKIIIPFGYRNCSLLYCRYCMRAWWNETITTANFDACNSVLLVDMKPRLSYSQGAYNQILL